jgi:hypothetical protein
MLIACIVQQPPKQQLLTHGTASFVLGKPSNNSESNTGQNYNWLLYNSLTSTVKPGSNLKSKTDFDHRFLTGCAFGHDLFETNRAASKVLLVDHCGFFCGKRVESKEVYFQRAIPVFSPTIDFKGLERLEDDARMTLIAERQIFTL